MNDNARGTITYLDDEERDLIKWIENEEWVPVTDVETVKERARRHAIATMQQDKRLNSVGLGPNLPTAPVSLDGLDR